MKHQKFDINNYRVQEIINFFADYNNNQYFINDAFKNISYYQQIFIIWRVIEIYGDISLLKMALLLQIEPFLLTNTISSHSVISVKSELFSNLNNGDEHLGEIDECFKYELSYLSEHNKLAYLYKRKEELENDILEWITRIRGLLFQREFKIFHIIPEEELSELYHSDLRFSGGVFAYCCMSRYKTHLFHLGISVTYEIGKCYLNMHNKFSKFIDNSKFINDITYFKSAVLMFNPQTFKSIICSEVLRMTGDITLDISRLQEEINNLYDFIKTREIYPAEKIYQSILEFDDSDDGTKPLNLLSIYSMPRADIYDYTYIIENDLRKVLNQRNMDRNFLKFKILKSTARRIYKIFHTQFIKTIGNDNELVSADISYFFYNLFEVEDENFFIKNKMSDRPLDLINRQGTEFVCAFFLLLSHNGCIRKWSFKPMESTLKFYLKRDGYNDRVGLSDRFRKDLKRELAKKPLNLNLLSRKIGFENHQEFVPLLRL